MRAEDKIIEGLSQLMDGFVELHSKIEGEFDLEGDEEDSENSDARIEIDAAIVTEMRATLEAVMDAEDYSADELATFITVTQDALEEIDPDVFEQGEEEDEDDVSYVGDDEDDDLDDDFEEVEFDEDEDDYDEEDEEY